MVACGLGRETFRFDFEKRKSKVVFGLELRDRIWTHGGAGLLRRCREKRRERERDEHFDFAKRGKARGWVFKMFSGSILYF